MHNYLKDYFPMLKTREEVLKEIQAHSELLRSFESWSEEHQEEFLNFTTGMRGVKITFDGFFKEILSPEYHPKRLEELLSLLLAQNVEIQQVLPNDSVRIADESTLLITDVVVQLGDGSIANVEIQKIGYAFPGQRSACYSSDMLLRQYKRVKNRQKKNFSYRDIKTVYTIILFEQSTTEFKKIPDKYIHRSKQIFDTELQIDLLQEYIFISLDNFKKSMQNKSINTILEAWLGFLCFDEPEKIAELVKVYPEFRVMYQEVYDICLNIERVMDMFSKELQELDRNTVQYMIEEQQEQLDEQKLLMAKQAKEIVDQERAIADQKRAIADQKRAIADQEKAIADQELKLLEQNAIIEDLRKELNMLKR